MLVLKKKKLYHSVITLIVFVFVFLFVCLFFFFKKAHNYVGHHSNRYAQEMICLNEFGFSIWGFLEFK